MVGHSIAISHFYKLNEVFWKGANSAFTATFFISLCILLSFTTMSIFMSSLLNGFKEIKEQKLERRR